MVDSPKSTAFYEGAPLDPNKLNQLITDVNLTYAQSVLTNKTVNQFTEQFSLVQDCGRVVFENVKANGNNYKKITLNNQAFKLDSTELPLIVSATISSNVANGIVASAVSKIDGGDVYLSVTASKDIAKVWVDWLITQKVKV